jgi:aconitate hydratase
MYLGVKAVFARSFARIHRSNLINFGILPVIAGEDAYALLEQGARISLSGILSAIDGTGPLKAVDLGTGKPLECTIEVSHREKDILKQGGLLNYIKSTVRG